MTNLNNKKKILISGGEGKFANQLIMANEEYDILSPLGCFYTTNV